MGVPRTFIEFISTYPDIGRAYQQLAEATCTAGPLDARAVQLVKLGLSIGMRHEGAVHAHTRRALEIGLTPDEIRHAVLLATTTMGFPNMMAALTWVEDILREHQETPPSE